MMKIVVTVLLGILFALPLLFWQFYKHYTRNYNYWKLRGVPYEKPVFPFGSVKEHAVLKKYTGFVFNELYKKFSQERYFGVYELNKPSFVIRDPELVKKVLVKDFQYFMDRAIFVPLPKDSLARNLVQMTGQEWKDMRHKLTPTFTSGKMKMMYVLMEKCSMQLKEYLTKKVNHNISINAKDMLARFTMDVIASCAFGLEINSLGEDSQFCNFLIGKIVIMRPSFKAQFIALYTPAWVKGILAKVSPSHTRKVITEVVNDAIGYRKKNNVVRNDFLDLLINLNQNKNFSDDNTTDFVKDRVSETDDKVDFTMEQITAQAFVFFLAGFETASSLMTFALYELSRHQDIQATLHHKIKEAVDNNGGQITYQLLMEIPYLEQVINETLRRYGSASLLSRSCTQAYQVPDSDLVLEKGQKVLIPIYSFHHDPQYFPDPYEFRPDRFSPENSRGRHPYVFLPFGEGPRNCIGMRFGLLQAKLGLATVILNFMVLPSPDQQGPINFSTTSLLTVPDAPVWIVLNMREDEC